MEFNTNIDFLTPSGQVLIDDVEKSRWTSIGLRIENGVAGDPTSLLHIVGDTLSNGNIRLEDNHTLELGTAGNSTISFDGVGFINWNLGGSLQLINGSVFSFVDFRLNDNSLIELGGAGDSTITYDGTNTVWDLQAVGTGGLTFQGGRVAIGGGNPGDLWMFDVASGGRTIRFGADAGVEETRTNLTEKRAAVGVYHATNAEEPIAVLFAQAQTGTSNLFWGGGTTLMNAASLQQWHVATGATTLTGTAMMRLTSAGLRIENGITGSATAELHVVGDFLLNGNQIVEDNHQIAFGTGGDSTITYDGTNTVWTPDAVGVGFVDMNGTMVFRDNEILAFGTAGDSQIFFDGTNTIWNPDAVGVGAIAIEGLMAFTDNNVLAFGSAADSQIRYDGTNTIWDPQVIGGGVIIIEGIMAFTDNNGVGLGTGADSRIIYDGTNTLWDLQNVGTGALNITGPVSIDQASATGAIPVLSLDQGDVSEEMMEFLCTIGTGNAIEAVAAKTLTTTHFIKVTITGGLTRYIPVGTIA